MMELVPVAILYAIFQLVVWLRKRRYSLRERRRE